MNRGLTGRYHRTQYGDEVVQAFIPHPLPPQPDLVWSLELQGVMERALLALGRLDSITLLLPNPELFLYSYVRKEAVLSAQIEGTQSSLSDLFVFEAEASSPKSLEDVEEVSNYVAAMEHGLGRLRQGFPLSLRLFKEVHAILLRGGRGAKKEPGEWRRSQNWIGGTRPGNARYVPPPPDELMSALGKLELYLNDDPLRHPVLVKAALAHVQFETIHPFQDGNGRLGRLLVTLLLCHERALSEPMLYLSLYFKQHRQAYYELLQRVRTEGAWEEWLEFFFTAVRSVAEEAVQSAHDLLAVAAEDRGHIQAMGRPAGSALRLHQALLRQPILSIPQAGKLTGLAPATVQSAFQHLVKAGMVNELSGKQRNKLYSYPRYLGILNRGTEEPA